MHLISLARSNRVATAVLVALGTLSVGALAQAADWKAAGSPSSLNGNFSDPSHWTGGTVPGAGDSTGFNVSGTYTVTFTGGPVSNVQLQQNGGDVTFNLAGNTWNTTAGISALFGYSSGASSTGMITDGTFTAVSVSVGYSAGTSSTLNLLPTSPTPIATTMTDSGPMVIGNSGTGIFSVQGGATGSSVNLTLGSSGTATGTMTITGAGSHWTDTGGNGVLVGSLGAGTLNVENKGKLTAGAVIVGRNAAAGTVTNSLNITGGSEIDGSYLSVGYAAGPNSTALISGSNSIFNATGVSYIGGGSVVGGTGALTLAQGGTLKDTGTVVLWHTGTIKFAGGTLDGPHLNAGYNSDAGGHLDVSYDSVSQKLNTITGILTLGGSSTTTMHLDSATQYGALNITSSAALNGALNVSLEGGYQPTAGTSFTLFTWGSKTSGFTSFNLPTLSPGLSWNNTINTDGKLSVVPEPAFLGLLSVGGLLTLRRRRAAAANDPAAK